MLSRSLSFLSMVSFSSLRKAAELNDLVNMAETKKPVEQDVLKDFLKRNVFPVLQGTSLDRRGNTNEMRFLLGRIIRDASFSAVILRASPDGRFVHYITECISNDAQRMRFLHKMTTTQATKCIEHLSRVGVRDPKVFSVLVSKVDFHNLKDIARVMFAFAEADLHALNVHVVAPLYCGERWALHAERVQSSAADEKHTEASASPGAGYNVFEAVRILRALSKSCRYTIDRNHARDRAMKLPVQSVELLRNSILDFIFQNDFALRGGHWVNIARALALFPPELQRLDSLDTADSATRKLLERKPSFRPQEDMRCTALAEMALERVFLAGGAEKADVPLDCTVEQLIKVLPLLQQIPSVTEEKQKHRIQRILFKFREQKQQLSFASLVRLLNALRNMELPPQYLEFIQLIAEEAGSHLLTPTEADERIVFKDVVTLATLLATFRIQVCAGFFLYIQKVQHLPKEMPSESAVSLLNALANVGRGDPRACHATVTAIARSVIRYEQRAVARGPHAAEPLVASAPTAADKMLRVFALLEVCPPKDVLVGFFGERGDVPRTAALRASAHGPLLFDLTRSLTHMVKEVRLRKQRGEAAADGSEDADVTHVLWERGVLRTVAPLLLEYTRELRESREHANHTYIPFAWRTAAEMAHIYADVSLEHNALADMQRVLADIYPFAKDLIIEMTWLAKELNDRIRHGASAARIRERYAAVPFKSNSIQHFVSALLMWENMLYQGAWQAKQRGALPEESKVEAIKSDFVTLLSTPLPAGMECNAKTTITVMGVLREIMGQGDTSVIREPVFLKEHVLDITTKLPFAISLVMDPGVVNEFFSE
ncbi:hypothetical protein STCU_07050, partial [Strigomonas culicis]